ncbi:dual specificity protein phosphatase 13-like [Scleropages formosus]|uniref:Dual specificity phosphatase 29 n=1 Tax=Scleropages formosus TaxID=113540 RepID=A0A8C9S349_SCLFO|nr:dual specificity protein phosphatase 13 [Scleropages formosus]XP_018616640.2 dual specificity protein phosphatase 13 [Scleropages formosus]
MEGGHTSASAPDPCALCFRVASQHSERTENMFNMSTGDGFGKRESPASPQESCGAASPEEPERPTSAELERLLYSGKSSCNHVDEVWPNLFLGDMCAAHDRHGLWKMGITHVLNAAHGKMYCKGSHDFYGTTVQYRGVPANDLPTFDMSPYFYSAADYIREALDAPGAKMFVHCAVGVSRSAALVLAFLMIHHHFSLMDAIKKVKESRWIFPNRGFLKQLQKLDADLCKKRRKPVLSDE